MIPKNVIDYFSDDPWFFQFDRKNIPNLRTSVELVNWILHKSGWPYFPLVLSDAPFQTMLKEALSIKDMFCDHRSDDYAHQGWKSVCIHGEAWNKTSNWQSYEENIGKNENEIKYDWCPEVVEYCPETKRYFEERFPQTNFQRLRFMLLEPNGYIQLHSDMPNLNIMGPINISLNNPTGCVFKMKDKGYIPFSNDGSAFILNVGYEHSVWNNSNIPRIHIISHGKPNLYFNKIVLNSLSELLK